jgi:hypothetical protein
LHEALLNRFDRYLLASQKVNTQRNFAEGPFAQKLDKLVKVKRGGWQLVCLLYVRANVRDQLLSLL